MEDTIELPVEMPRGDALAELLSATGLSQRALAKRYQVSNTTVYKRLKDRSSRPWYVERWPWDPRPEHCGRAWIYRALVAYTKTQRPPGYTMSEKEMALAKELIAFLEHNDMVLGYHPQLHATGGWYTRDRKAGDKCTLRYLVKDAEKNLASLLAPRA